MNLAHACRIGQRLNKKCPGSMSSSIHMIKRGKIALRVCSDQVSPLAVLASTCGCDAGTRHAQRGFKEKSTKTTLRDTVTVMNQFKQT